MARNWPSAGRVWSAPVKSRRYCASFCPSSRPVRLRRGAPGHNGTRWRDPRVELRRGHRPFRLGLLRPGIPPPGDSRAPKPRVSFSRTSPAGRAPFAANGGHVHSQRRPSGREAADPASLQPTGEGGSSARGPSGGRPLAGDRCGAAGWTRVRRGDWRRRASGGGLEGPNRTTTRGRLQAGRSDRGRGEKAGSGPESARGEPGGPQKSPGQR